MQSDRRIRVKKECLVHLEGERKTLRVLTELFLPQCPLGHQHHEASDLFLSLLFIAVIAVPRTRHHLSNDK